METEITAFHPSLNPWGVAKSLVSQMEPKERDAFRDKLVQAYQPDARKGFLTCMVTGLELPESDVCAAHIWPAHARSIFAEKWFGLGDGDFDSCRNGILMAKSLEEKFDEQRIAFVPDIETDEYHILLVHHRLRGPAQNIPELERLSRVNDTIGDVTLGRLLGKTLTFTNPNGPRPFRRILFHHYATALGTAASRNWRLPEKMPATPDVSSRNKVMAWLQGKSPGALWPGLQPYSTSRRSASSSGTSPPNTM